MGNFEVLVKKSTSIRDVTLLMSDMDRNKGIAGLAVVVDEGGKVLGSVSDGDIRRAISRDLDFAEEVSKIMNTDPICLQQQDPQAMHREALRKIEKRRDHIPRFHTNKMIVTDPNKGFLDVCLLQELNENDIDNKTVGVYGLGFVGLTLAAVMANRGLKVKGVDSNENVISSLESGKAHFYEDGLDSLLKSLKEREQILFSSDVEALTCDVHIISVGTPVDQHSEPSMEFIRSATGSVAQKLKRGDIVIYRSTVPVGTTRDFSLPILEKSGLKAGQDFAVAFAPERTVEGAALHELQSLPQIVGGLTRGCTQKAASLFRKVTDSIVEVESLEAAEMIKLVNNTFRDVVFAFANEVSEICDTFNVNAFHLIEAANNGYPRNPVPKPSPGVGGTCLSKDPFLYGKPAKSPTNDILFGRTSRQINSRGHEYVVGKVKEHCLRNDKKFSELKIFLVGLAFKGNPETSDLRNSVSVDLLQALPEKRNVRVKDFVVSDEEIKELEVTTVDKIEDGFKGADVVLVMNNHYLNSRFNLYDALASMNTGGLFFDGWNMFSAHEVEAINETTYCTMGYMTPPIER